MRAAAPPETLSHPASSKPARARELHRAIKCRVTHLRISDEHLEKASLIITVPATDEPEVPLVHEHRLAVDFAPFEPAVAVRAERDQVLEVVLLKMRPRPDVSKLSGGRAACRERATVASLD
jgi:hypothetical protein